MAYKHNHPPITCAEIIQRCSDEEWASGPLRIQEASENAHNSEGSVKAWSVYKWKVNGIPERHWPLVMALSGATLLEMHTANIQAREALQRKRLERTVNNVVDRCEDRSAP